MEARGRHRRSILLLQLLTALLMLASEVSGIQVSGSGTASGFGSGPGSGISGSGMQGRELYNIIYSDPAEKINNNT